MTKVDGKPKRAGRGQSESERQAVLPIVAKTLAEGSGVPFVGALVGGLVDLMKEHVGRTREAIQIQNEERLAAFYSEMLEGGAAMDAQVASVMVDDKDFHALLRACIAEIEAEKVGPLRRSCPCYRVRRGPSALEKTLRPCPEGPFR
jgi:hypothetical protein